MSAIGPRSETFAGAYRSVFGAFLDSRDERYRSQAYELGRQAVTRDLTILELADAHHDALAAALADADDAADVARAAGDFFLEALSAFELAQRAYRAGREQAALERRQATLLRQLSNFLADASLALGASDSLGEMLQLVAEQARELLGADRCRVVLAGHGAATSEADWAPVGVEEAITAELTALDGRELGRIELAGKNDGVFTGLDRAVLTQLAQMASAAVERHALYRRGQYGFR
jgi:hypothetical protein